MGAVKKLTDAVSALFSETARAEQEEAKARAAVAEAQRLFDATPSQAAGEALMAAKRELERAKLYVDRGQRLQQAQQKELEQSLQDAQRAEIADLEASADESRVHADISALVDAAAPALAALARLDRDVLKRIRSGLEAVQRAEKLRAQLEGRAYDHDATTPKMTGLRVLESAHASLAKDLALRSGDASNLRWLGRIW